MAEVGLRWWRRDAAMNRTEDLNVKVREEALSSLIHSGWWCSKALPTDHERSKE
jgi:hypothetical protein